MSPARRSNVSPHMRRISVATLLLALAIIPLRGADWLTHSGDPQRSGWQKDETKISKDSVKNLKLLYSVKLDTKQRSVYSLYGPLILERAITDRGFKELAFVAGANNDFYAVDADLGKIFWKKHFDWHGDAPETEQANFLCPGGLTAWPVLQPPPQRGRGPGGPPPAPPAPPAPAAPRAPRAPGAAPAAPRRRRAGRRRRHRAAAEAFSRSARFSCSPATATCIRSTSTPATRSDRPPGS